MKIKGKYVAQIEMNFSVDENTPGLLPFDELQEEVKNKMESAIKELLVDEFGDLTSKISVVCLYRDMWKEVLKDESQTD